MDFLLEKAISKIKDLEIINASSLLDCCSDDPYLPHNRSDIYVLLTTLKNKKYIIGFKKGQYRVNKEFIEKELGARK